MIWTLLGIACSAVASLFFSTVSYALRDMSRARLEDALRSYRRSQWLEYTIRHRADLAFVTAVGRLITNVLILLLSLRLFQGMTAAVWLQYLLAAILACTLTIFASVAFSTALARYLGEPAIALSVRFLHLLRVVFLPLTRMMHAIDQMVRRASGAGSPDPEEIEKDILSVVEEGEKEGAVDREERQMIESVIEFRNTTAGQTMTARPEIVAIEMGASLDEVRRIIEESGHSRVPVYDGTLDHIVGILYARDLLKYVGRPPEQFDIRSAMRPAIFVPETKPLRDLMNEFRIQKVHIAIVLDEYGGTAGLVTIEDLLEELVGEISDEHEPQEPAMFKKLSETAYEADARLYLDEFNRLTALNLPEDAGFDTLGGFVSTTLGRIPQQGTSFEHAGARFTVLDAEPQRVKRLKIELLPQPANDQG